MPLAAIVAVAAPNAAQAQAETDEEKVARLEKQLQTLTERLDALEAVQRGALPTETAIAKQSGATKPADVAAATPVAVSPSAASPRQPPVAAASTSMPAVPLGPADRSLGAPDRPAQFQISASTASSQASFAITRTVGRPNLDGKSRGVATYSSLTFGAQAPLDKGGGSTDLATLDGLANSFAVKIGFSQMRVAIAEPGASSEALETKAVATCRADPKVDPKKDCDVDTNRQNILQTYLSGDEYRAYLDGGFPSKTAIVFGASGRIGYNKFSYLDATTGAKASLSRAPWSIGAYATLLPGVTATSLTAAVEYQRAYKEQSTGVICPAAIAATPTTCLTGPVGAPKLTDKVLLSLEGRHLFATGSTLLPTIGLAPQVTYDAIGDQVGLDLPIYLVSDDKGGLLGGVRVGWTSKQGGFIAGIFVGTSFSLFQGN